MTVFFFFESINLEIKIYKILNIIYSIMKLVYLYEFIQNHVRIY